MNINRKELLDLHNPVITGIKTDSPLTVGNGELAFTADVTGLQTLYEEYTTLPLCTMSQWGWHTKPAKGRNKPYTLEDITMTKYDWCGKTVTYPQKKQPGNEEVYDWLRENPHRLNLARIRLFDKERKLDSTRITHVNQELHLYEGILESNFYLDEIPVSVTTACGHEDADVLAFEIKSQALAGGNVGVTIDFPYGSPHISGSDWNSPKQHSTTCIKKEADTISLLRRLDGDSYHVLIKGNGNLELLEDSHCLTLFADGPLLEFTVAFGKEEGLKAYSSDEVLKQSRHGLKQFWEEGGIIRLNKSKAKEAFELERRIILSQYLMAVNCCGSAPPQETGLTCNSWYGKMHLEMYLWHCAWLPLWNHGTLLERSLSWYQKCLLKAKENARRNGYKGARWPKMVALEGDDTPSPVAPLLVWQQPHIIYMLEMAYRQNPSDEFLRKYWELVKETADFMVDFVVWNKKRGCYDICAPVIPVQECHKAAETKNPAFELEYWCVTLRMAADWAERLGLKVEKAWKDTAEHMAPMASQNGLYLAHENCPETFTRFCRDHPSMLGSFGLIDSGRTDSDMMKDTLMKVLECWDYSTLWGWDFAMMAMTAVRLKKPELTIKILLMDTLKNNYVTSGNNIQITRHDLPLYLPGNGSLLLAAALMTAGYPGCKEKTPGFPDDGTWEVEFENIEPFSS